MGLSARGRRMLGCRSELPGDGESACKPDSVGRRLAAAPRWPSICAAYLGTWAGPAVPRLALLRVGVAEPPGSPPTLVRSYRTVSPLPVRATGTGAPPSAVCSLLPWTDSSRRPGSRQHPCPTESGLSSTPSKRRRDHPADSPSKPGYPAAGAARTVGRTFLREDPCEIAGICRGFVESPRGHNQRDRPICRRFVEAVRKAAGIAGIGRRFVATPAGSTAGTPPRPGVPGTPVRPDAQASDDLAFIRSTRSCAAASVGTFHASRSSSEVPRSTS